MNDLTLVLPASPVNIAPINSMRTLTPVGMYVPEVKAITPIAEKIIDLPSIAEEIALPLPTKKAVPVKKQLPVKKVAELTKKFEKLEKDVKKEVKKFDKAPVAKVKAKAKPVAQKKAVPVKKATKKAGKKK